MQHISFICIYLFIVDIFILFTQQHQTCKKTEMICFKINTTICVALKHASNAQRPSTHLHTALKKSTW